MNKKREFSLQELVAIRDKALSRQTSGHGFGTLSNEKIAALADMALRYAISQMPSDHPELIAHRERVSADMKSWSKERAVKFFQEIGILGADGGLTTTYGGKSPRIDRNKEPTC